MDSQDAQRTDAHWSGPHASGAAQADTAYQIYSEGPLSGDANVRPAHGLSAEVVTDAVLTASRLFVGVSARSIAAIEESITIPQFRILVVLYTLGPTKPSSVAEILHVNPSSVTRMVRQLTAANLVERRINPVIRREVLLELTQTGARTVAEVTVQQHRNIADIVERMPEQHRTYLVEALEAFNVAGGESPVPSIPDDWI